MRGKAALSRGSKSRRIRQNASVSPCSGEHAYNDSLQRDPLPVAELHAPAVGVAFEA